VPSEEEGPNKERPKLRLKNGTDVAAVGAYNDWKELQDVDGDQLKALAALAEGDDSKVNMRMRAELMTAHPAWFTDDGVLTADTQNVIQSAVRDSGDGKVVVTPFLLATQKEVDLLTVVHHLHASIGAVYFDRVLDELNDKQHVSSTLREQRRRARRLAKEARNPDDPGYSTER
jgi:hypothetical protein